MGSVAEETVRMASCPVLTVRPNSRGLLAAAAPGATVASGDGAASAGTLTGR